MNQVGRPLSAAEIDSYDVIPKYLARRVRVVSVPLLPGGYDGMTLGYRIFLSKEVDQEGNSALLAHELVHVRQWAESGRFGFSVDYVGSFLRGLGRFRSWRQAYLSIQAEEQARIETSDWLRRKTRRELADPPE